MWLKNLHLFAGILLIVLFRLALGQSGLGVQPMQFLTPSVFDQKTSEEVKGETNVIKLEATDEPQELTSPRWPQKYGPNSSYTWTITTSPGLFVEISLLHFSLEDSHDFLTMHNEDGLSSRLTGSPCINAFHQPVHISPTNRLRLIFTSDADTQESGFRISYRASNDSDITVARRKFEDPLTVYTSSCLYEVDVFPQPKSIITRRWPEIYAANLSCTWSLIASNNGSIDLTFLAFQTELCCDYVMMWDGGVPVGIFQGSICPKPYISTSSNVTLQFQTDESYQDTGFVIQYQLANSSNSTILPTPTITKEFVEAASSKLMTNREFCQPNGSIFNNRNDNDIFLWFPHEKEMCPAVKEPEFCFSCNKEAALENLNEVLKREDLQIDEALLTNATNTISQLLVESNQRLQINPNNDKIINDNETSEILTTFNEFVRRAGSDFQRNSTDRVVKFNYSADDVAVQIFSVAARMEQYHNSSITTMTNSVTKLTYPNATFKLHDRRNNDTVEVVISSEAVTEVAEKSQNSQPVFYATMLGDLTFSSNDLNSSQIVTSGTSESVEETLQNQTLTFKNETVPEKEKRLGDGTKTELQQIRLKRWDYSTSTWVSSSNCKRIRDKPPTYDCGRFATYAILFSSRVVPSVTVLWYVSIIGTVLSIVFLFATVIIHLSFRELRLKPTAATLINICVCLIAVYFFFAVGVQQVAYKNVCDSLTFLLHYFALTCVSWMTVNAFQMYKAFTTLQTIAYKPRRLLYVGVYGIPFLLVLLNFSVTVLYYDKRKDQSDINFESLYRAKYACWLQPPSFYYGFVLPLGLLLICNYVIFAILLKKVIMRKKEIRSTAKETSSVDRLVNAITMATMMGLTWIFGYLILIPSNVNYLSAMQWLFTIFNVFQGILIFYLHCLRRENVRKIWFKVSLRNQHSSMTVPFTHKNSTSNGGDCSEATL